MRIRIRAAALFVAAALLFGWSAGLAGPARAEEPAPTPTPVVTGNIPVIAISPELCFLLAAVNPKATTFTPVDCQQLNTEPGALRRVADVFGDGDGKVEPSDFAAIDLDGNQVHQMDDYAGFFSNSGSLWILAFVPNDAPVEFRTNRGVFVPPHTSGAVPGVPPVDPDVDPVGQVWRCDSQTGELTDQIEDTDCSGQGYERDGVVVARLRARYGDNIADIGPGTVTVTQASTDQATIKFRVVGEPRSVSFTTLESTIQDGITDMTTQCPLPGDSAGFLGANGTAERSIVLAIAKDIEGNAVTGAIINWKTDDKNKAQMAAGLTPTLDLGAFGFGAPNIICGTENPGTVEVEARISKDVVVGSTQATGADPGAVEGKKTIEFTVVGTPASVTLVAAPAELTCDGVATATVTASVIDAQGSPVAAGQQVHFDVQVLGTANPVNAKTDAKGVASSVITPLSGDAAGVPVVVTSGDARASLLVSCAKAGTGAAPAAPPPSAAPPPAASGGAPSSAVSSSARLPRSGEATAQMSSVLPPWTYLLAGGALGLMISSALVRARARAKRR